VPKEALLAGVGQLVDGEQDVEDARQERRGPVLDADGVVAADGQFDLVAVGGDGLPEDRVVAGDDRALQRFRVGLRRRCLEATVPAVGVDERTGVLDVVPEAGGVAERRFVADEDAVEPFRDPGGGAVDHVDRDAGAGVDPLVAGSHAVLPISAAAANPAASAARAARGGDSAA
jgi:hypothetical protein